MCACVGGRGRLTNYAVRELTAASTWLGGWEGRGRGEGDTLLGLKTKLPCRSKYICPGTPSNQAARAVSGTNDPAAAAGVSSRAVAAAAAGALLLLLLRVISPRLRRPNRFRRRRRARPSGDERCPGGSLVARTVSGRGVGRVGSGLGIWGRRGRLQGGYGGMEPACAPVNLREGWMGAIEAPPGRECEDPTGANSKSAKHGIACGLPEEWTLKAHCPFFWDQ